MLRITDSVVLPLSEIEFNAIRSQGPGGQNVNKVATAIQLRFDIDKSGLPDFAKTRLRSCQDSRISSEGIIVIKAQNHRHQSQNKREALNRFIELCQRALHKPKTRRATRPSRASIERRLSRKSRRGELKSKRGRVRDVD